MAKDSLVTVKFDKAKLDRVAKKLKGFKGALPKVMSRGINRTAKTARTKIARRLVTISKLKYGNILKSISLRKATYQVWRAVLDIFGRRIPLIRFKARQSKRKHTVLVTGKQATLLFYKVFKKKYGDSAVFSKQYRIRRPFPLVTYMMGGKKKQITDGAFITTMKTGHKGVFKSRSDVKGAVTELYGPSVGGLYEKAGTVAKVTLIEANRNLVKNIDDQVKVILEKKTG